MDRNFTVYRYEIPITSKLLSGDVSFTLDIPAGAVLLNADCTTWRAKAAISVWYMVDTKITDTKQVEFVVLGTGFGYVDSDTLKQLEWINTIVCKEAEEVYHVFQKHPIANIAKCACTCEKAA